MATQQIRSTVVVQLNGIDLNGIVPRTYHQHSRIARPINPHHIIMCTEEISSQHKTVVFSSYFARCLKNKHYHTIVTLMFRLLQECFGWNVTHVLFSNGEKCSVRTEFDTCRSAAEFIRVHYRIRDEANHLSGSLFVDRYQ